MEEPAVNDVCNDQNGETEEWQHEEKYHSHKKSGEHE